MLKRLLFPAILLVAGCDDPEVADKALTVLEHGVAAAQINCYHFQAPLASPSPGFNHIHYKATKLVDGSCLVLLEANFQQQETLNTPVEFKRFDFVERSSAYASTCRIVHATDYQDPPVNQTPIGFQSGVDGFNIFVQDGNLVGEFRDSEYPRFNCGQNGNGPACTNPRPWFSYDITGADCTGFNLQEFGATP